MMRLTYAGVDITDSISINRCYHDMYAAGRSDTLNLRVNDAHNLWDRWSPVAGDEISVDYGSIGTGTMFVSSVVPENGLYTITAQAAPMSGFDPQYKAWQRVRLLQIGEEIAARNGLTFHNYGVEDRLYEYILQNNEGDLRFLNRRAQLEGCALIVFDKKLIMYSEQYMEQQQAVQDISIHSDGMYKYTDRSIDLYGSCVVENGLYSGSYSASNGSSRIYRPAALGNIGSDEEARRFAKNLLRSVNKGCRSGYVRANVLTGYAAASMAYLTNERAPSWDGAVFIDHIRNDYGTGQSKIFFRKPLEGY